MNGPSQIAQNYVNVGVGKTRYSVLKTLTLGFLAGAFIAFGGLGSTIASFGVQPAGVARIVSALVFPIGLMLVLCAGGELFTGNCLIIIPVIEKRITVRNMLKNWFFAYLGNLIGGMAVAAAVVATKTLDAFPGLPEAAVNTAIAKVSMPLYVSFIKGIMCNFLVCLAVWVAFGAGELSGKIIALYLPVFLFVLCGFEHCIANMYFIPIGLFENLFNGIPAQNLNWFTFGVFNLVPVTLGNILGGAVFVGVFYWAEYLKRK